MMSIRSKNSESSEMDRIFIDLTEVEITKSKRASSVRVLKMNSAADIRFVAKGIAPRTPVVVDASNCEEDKKELTDAVRSTARELNAEYYEVNDRTWIITLTDMAVQTIRKR